MPYSMLQAGCCCAEAEGDGTDPGEGQLIRCFLFETCAGAGYKPSVLSFSTTGSKAGIIVPGTDIELAIPGTNIDVTDVRVDDFSQNPWNLSRYSAFAEVDLNASFDCSGCNGSASGTIRVIFTVECREEGFPFSNRFTASVIPALGEGTLFIPNSCSPNPFSVQTFMDESLAEIDHDDVPGTGCVALESVRLRPFNTFNINGSGCGAYVESGDLFKLTFDIQLLRSPE